MAPIRMTSGRQRIEMKRIQNEEALQVTFSKRRTGLFKKASELAILCGAEVGVVVFSPAGRPYSFGSPDIDTISTRFMAGGLAAPPDPFMNRSLLVKELIRDYTDLVVIRDMERQRLRGMQAALRAIGYLSEDEMSSNQMKEHLVNFDLLRKRLEVHKAQCTCLEGKMLAAVVAAEVEAYEKNLMASHVGAGNMFFGHIDPGHARGSMNLGAAAPMMGFGDGRGDAALGLFMSGNTGVGVDSIGMGTLYGNVYPTLDGYGGYENPSDQMRLINGQQLPFMDSFDSGNPTDQHMTVSRQMDLFGFHSAGGHGEAPASNNFMFMGSPMDPSIINGVQNNGSSGEIAGFF